MPEELTPNDVAGRLGMSPAEVRRIEWGALLKLRQWLTSRGIGFDDLEPDAPIPEYNYHPER
jgi:hypothetical protein